MFAYDVFGYCIISMLNAVMIFQPIPCIKRCETIPHLGGCRLWSHHHLVLKSWTSPSRKRVFSGNHSLLFGSWERLSQLHDNRDIEKLFLVRAVCQGMLRNPTCLRFRSRRSVHLVYRFCNISLRRISWMMPSLAPHRVFRLLCTSFVVWRLPSERWG